MDDIIIGMLHNITTGRFHPIVFFESPLPGEGKPTRHKSKNHHTEGFATREEALAEVELIRAKLLLNNYKKVRTALSKDFVWDEKEEDVPARVVFFVEDYNKELVVAF